MLVWMAVMGMLSSGVGIWYTRFFLPQLPKEGGKMPYYLQQLLHTVLALGFIGALAVLVFALNMDPSSKRFY